MYWDEFLDLFKSFTIAALAMLVLTLGSGKVRAELSFPGELAQIEQLRSDVTKVSTGSNEDVIGQVTAANQTIALNQRYRKIWWSHMFVASGWDEVEPIVIPATK
jgi:hypothetical protein